MLTPAADLKAKLANNDPVVGILAMDLANPVLVEVAQRSGLDYLIVDREHGAFSDETVAEFCRVGRLAQFPVLLRTISTEESIVRRAADLGPSGILLPNVESVEQLDRVREAVWMPPRGRRRPGGPGNYWMRDFQYETWRSEFEEHFIVIPQIESKTGVENASALAGHPIVTALGVGPYDLSADLGCCWDPENEEFEDSIAKIKSAADAAGKKVWIGANAEKYRSEGYTFLWVGTFTSVLGGALSDRVKGLKGDTGSAESELGEPPPA
ncbi:MAG: hypothetical protein HKN23_20750 [Verrucomicrobiales bacterium]|nr:hypothetical protein [Verrucomicrobiales bacterium]